MDNSIISGIALGTAVTGIALLTIFVFFFALKKNNDTTTGMTYEYDDQNRLRNVQPINNIRLVPAGN